MEWPKRARTADWENGVLTLDGEKKFDIPELTTEIMERLAGYTLVQAAHPAADRELRNRRKRPVRPAKLEAGPAGP